MYIDIREYYTDKKTMDMMPGKKGAEKAPEKADKADKPAPAKGAN